MLLPTSTPTPATTGRTQFTAAMQRQGLVTRVDATTVRPASGGGGSFKGAFLADFDGRRLRTERLSSASQIYRTAVGTAQRYGKYRQVETTMLDAMWSLPANPQAGGLSLLAITMDDLGYIVGQGSTWQPLGAGTWSSRPATIWRVPLVSGAAQLVDIYLDASSHVIFGAVAFTTSSGSPAELYRRTYAVTFAAPASLPADTFDVDALNQ